LQNARYLNFKNAATCSHSSGRKWSQVAASGRSWSKWPQVATSGHEWPLEQVAASGRKWPQVAASGHKWPQAAAGSGCKWPQVAAWIAKYQSGLLHPTKKRMKGKS